MIRRVAVGVVAGMAALVLAAGCSDAGGTKGTTAPSVTICKPGGTAQATADLPKVTNIQASMAALDAKLGAPQQYFEVNTTARVTNLFVALNGGTKAQPWVYVDGVLSSKEAQNASGGTFAKADVVFEPDQVLTKIHGQIPDAILESFYVNGDGKGNVQYGVLTSAQCGGGLDIIVGPDGSVKSVDPVQ